MAKIIMHIDLNAFFASAELLRYPQYKGLPLAIGDDSRRSVISTASYEARKYGVHSAMPIYQAKRLCPSLILLPPDFAYYKDLSSKFFDLIREHYSSIIEPVSIDECFVDMTLALKEVKKPIEYLKNMQLHIKKELGLGCSIGISTTKFLAKMGSDYKKPMGITIIRKKDIPLLLYPLPISDFYGIGKKTSEKLIALGINTIGDFAKNDSYEVKHILGKAYESYKNNLLGIGNDEVITEEEDPKSISSSETFLYDTALYEEIKDSLSRQAHDVAQSLKKHDMVGLTIHITLRDGEFHTTTRSKTYTTPIEKEEIILQKGLDLLDTHWKGEPLRLIGIGISSLHKKDSYYVQISLFDEEHIEDKSIQYLIKNLNKKMEKDVFMTAKDLLKKRGK